MKLKQQSDAELIVETLREPIVLLDPDLRLRSANSAFYHTFNLQPEQAESRPLFTLGPHEWDTAELRRAFAAILPHDTTVENYRFEHNREGLGRRFMVINAERLDDTDSILATFGDVTDAELARQREHMKLEELNHRVKNLLAAVQCIASQTLESSHSLENFRAAFEGRIRSLATVQAFIVAGNGEGVPLRAMVEQELKPYCYPITNQCVLSGEDVALSASAAYALQLVLHELTTNAAKYGALSVESGRLDVSWSLTGDDKSGGTMNMTWIESGGPRVSPPKEPGFGTRLVRKIVEFELGGEVTLRYDETGFSFELEFPYSMDFGVCPL